MFATTSFNRYSSGGERGRFVEPRDLLQCVLPRNMAYSSYLRPRELHVVDGWRVGFTCHARGKGRALRARGKHVACTRDAHGSHVRLMIYTLGIVLEVTAHAVSRHYFISSSQLIDFSYRCSDPLRRKLRWS